MNLRNSVRLHQIGLKSYETMNFDASHVIGVQDVCHHLRLRL